MTDQFLRRGLCLVATACVALVGTADPALATGVANVLPSTGTVSFETRQVTKLERRAVELQARVTEADAAHAEAVRALTLQADNVMRLADQVEHAERVAHRLYRQATAQAPDGALDALAGLLFHSDAEEAVARAAEAAANVEHLQQMVHLANAALAEQQQKLADAERVQRAARARVAQLSGALTARAAALTAAREAEFPETYRASDRAQDRVNRRALADWQAYLGSVADAAIVPPHTDDLLEPGRLSGKLEQVHDGRGKVVKGAAQVYSTAAAPLPIVSRETVRAVSAAFSRMGLRQDFAAEPVASACRNLVTASWQTTRLAVAETLDDQWHDAYAVPVRQVQIGDTVYVDDPGGVQGAGIYVGGQQAIVFDPTPGEVAVRHVGAEDILGVRRLTVPADDRRTSPVPTALTASCGGAPTDEAQPEVAVAAPEGTSAWTLPLAEGTYSMSAAFGASGSMWSSGEHTGQDFAAPEGTPVYATRGGVVSVEASDWAGQLVRVDHGGGVESWYAHMSAIHVATGDIVRAGELVGEVGSEGNSTGPHLHFEIRADGSPLDPVLLLASGSTGDLPHVH